MLCFSSYRLPLYLSLVSLSLAATTVRPNHVAINEKRKHIDIDSSWLDKTGKEVQRVSYKNVTIFTSVYHQKNY